MSNVITNKENTGPPKGHAARSRFVPKPVAGLRLEARDERLLCDLFLHRVMSRGQLQSLYFTSLVRCNARLRQLFDHGFVARYYLPAAPYGAQAVYSIGKGALPLVAKALEMELPEVSRHYRRTNTPTFIEHTLAIVDVWIALREAVMARDDIEIDLWLPEILCRHEYEIRAVNGSGWRREVFKPDAFVRLRDSSSQELHSYFIEVDLGHTSSRQFLGKLLNHRRYLESGLFREIFNRASFRTLVITTSVKRLANLQKLAAENGFDHFWFTTFEEVTASSITNSIWHTPGCRRLNSIVK